MPASWMLCQACGTRNPAGEETCGRCAKPLLVVSGGGGTEGLEPPPAPDDSLSFDEHLLERISILEEAVKRAGQTATQLVDALAHTERSLLVSQTGLDVLRELMEAKGVLGAGEWSEAAQSRMDRNLEVLERRQRFAAARERILGLYRGRRRERFSRHLEDADRAFSDLEPDRALASLEAAFRLDRRNHELAYLIGEAWFNEGETRRALRYFSKVLKAEPDHFQTLVYAGVVRQQGGEYAVAKEFLERAVALQPEAFLPLFSLGAVYADQEQYSHAIILLERAVAVDAVPHALFLLGRCLYESGRPGRAIDALERVVRLDPGFDEGYYLLGLAYLARGWNRKALAAFQQAEKVGGGSISLDQKMMECVRDSSRRPEKVRDRRRE